MKYLLMFSLVLMTSLSADRLKIEAKDFTADEKKGVSVFTGNVKIKKGADELNASKVTVYTNENKKVDKFVAVGNVKFYIKTETNDIYQGRAQKAILKPLEKSYHFFTDVYLTQINKKKEITGEEVYINTIKGEVLAKGAKKKPVIMIFDLAEDDEKK